MRVNQPNAEGDDLLKLKICFEDVIWMAIRYADQRKTYAPSQVRDAIKNFQEVFPDWKPRPDRTIEPPTGEEIISDDSLYDLVKI